MLITLRAERVKCTHCWDAALIYVLAVLCVNYLSLKYGMFVLNKLNLQY